MKRNLFFLSLAFVLCLSVSSVNAASLSLLPANQAVIPGSQVAIDLGFDFSDDTAFGIGMILTADPSSVLSLVSYTMNSTFDALVDDAFTTLPTETTPGTFGTLGFGDFGGITGMHTVGTYLFDVSSAATGSVDLSMALDSFATDSGNPPDLIGASINVNAVPIPGALLLLGSGLIGLVGLRKKVS